MTTHVGERLTADRIIRILDEAGGELKVPALYNHPELSSFSTREIKQAVHDAMWDDSVIFGDLATSFRLNG